MTSEARYYPCIDPGGNCFEVMAYPGQAQVRIIKNPHFPYYPNSHKGNSVIDFYKYDLHQWGYSVSQASRVYVDFYVSQDFKAGLNLKGASKEQEEQVLRKKLDRLLPWIFSYGKRYGEMKQLVGY